MSAVQKLSGAMQMSPAFAPPLDHDALQHPRLQRSTRFLYGPEAIRVGSLLEFVERVQAWFLVKLEYLVRPQARHGEHFEHGHGDILAHRPQDRVVTGRVKLGDDICNGPANSRNFSQEALRYDVFQGL